MVAERKAGAASEPPSVSHGRARPDVPRTDERLARSLRETETEGVDGQELVRPSRRASRSVLCASLDLPRRQA